MPVTEDRFNLFAAWGEPVVVLSTHIDTVPPFFPSSEDDEHIHGRGACDTKGLLAAMIKALGEKGLNLTTKEVKAMKDGQILKIIVEGAGSPAIVGEPDLRAVGESGFGEAKRQAAHEALRRQPLGLALDLGDEAFVHVSQLLEPGWTEKQIAWEIEKYAREAGMINLTQNMGAFGLPGGKPLCEDLPEGVPQPPKSHGWGLLFDGRDCVAGYAAPTWDLFNELYHEAGVSDLPSDSNSGMDPSVVAKLADGQTPPSMVSRRVNVPRPPRGPQDPEKIFGF